MGGIVIDIWEKSNFFGAFGSQKDAKNTIFVQGGLMVGLKFFKKHSEGEKDIEIITRVTSRARISS